MVHVARLIVVVLLLVATPASAQYAPVDFSQQTFNAMNISTNFVMSSSLLKGAFDPRPARGKPAPRLATVTKGRGNGPRTMAAAYPEDRRAELERGFTQLLEVYGKIETQFKIPRGDLAGALATVVIASIEAYRDIEVDPKHFAQLVDKLRAQLAGHPAFAKTSMADRRAAYEQLAITGMLVAGTRQLLQKQPNPLLAQQLRDASKAYLVALSVDPDAKEFAALAE